MRTQSTVEQVEADLKEMGVQPLLQIPDICRSLGISRSVAYEAVRKGDLLAYRRGGVRGPFLIRRADLARWLTAYRAN